jgi:hypothetical protein
MTTGFAHEQVCTLELERNTANIWPGWFAFVTVWGEQRTNPKRPGVFHKFVAL